MIFFVISALISCSLFSVSFVDGQNPPPVQQECTNRRALIADFSNVSEWPKKWTVGYATQMTTLPSSAPDPPEMNSCTPITYLTACNGAIDVRRDWAKNGDMIVITKAYSSEFNDIAEYTESQGLVDTNFLIYGGFGTEMKIHYRDKATETVQLADMPALVYYAQAQNVAITAMTTGEKLEWMLHQVCGVDIAWVEFSENVIADNRQSELMTNEINPILQKLQVSTMVEVPIGLPF